MSEPPLCEMVLLGWRHDQPYLTITTVEHGVQTYRLSMIAYHRMRIEQAQAEMDRARRDLQAEMLTEQNY